MIRVALAEDEQEYSRQMMAHLQRYSKEYDVPIDVTLCTTGKQAAESEQEFDIILLDIIMPDMNGMEAAERIRGRDEQVVLIFITQMAQYAISGYSVGALDVILKPVAYDTFAMKFARAIARVRSREGALVTLTLPGGMKRLQTRDIYYVEIQNHMLHYFTASGEYVLRGTMAGAEKELTGHHFAKCNHCYLVNLAHVSEINKDTVTVAGHELAISRRNRNTFLTAVTNYLGGNT